MTAPESDNQTDPPGSGGHDTLPDTAVVWPISGTSTPDTKEIVFPFGPRNIGSYDFHAGIDIYVARGTPVGSIMAGTAFVVNKSTVIVLHSNDRRSAYLHMDTVLVENNSEVYAGDVIGTVGNVNAKDVHLHLTYMVGEKRYIDEIDARNPLRILPFNVVHQPTARFAEDSVVITLYAGNMTVQQIEVEYADGTKVTLDYDEIIKQGRTLRHGQIQSGVHIDSSLPRKVDAGGREFDLVLAPADATATIRGVVLKDFEGKVLLKAERW